MLYLAQYGKVRMAGWQWDKGGFPALQRFQFCFLLFRRTAAESGFRLPNHSILYLVSMLYDSIGASMPFWRGLSLFVANHLKCLSMNNLRAKATFPNQGKSRLIKLLFEP
jgi:hypothetical protein